MVESAKWLPIALMAIGGYNAGTVWLAQVSGYPLAVHVGAPEFRRYYGAWSRGVRAMIFVPLLVALFGAIALLFVRPVGFPGWAAWLAIALSLAMVVLTVVWWSPPMADIVQSDGGLNLTRYTQLTHTHWLRVGLATAFEVLACWSVGSGMGSNGWILTATSASAFYSLGNIWLVHVVCYRLWPYVGSGEFYTYHVAWWHSIWGVIFVPAGLVLAGCVAMIWVHPPGASTGILRIGLGLQVLLYVLTAIWWGPLMARLATREQGLLLQNYRLLMTTHWARVAIVSAYAFVALRMLLEACA